MMRGDRFGLRRLLQRRARAASTISRVLIALCLAGMTEGCRHPTAAAVARPAVNSSRISIAMQRGACYRTCPVYTVSIASTGGVHFRGLANVVVAGDVVDTLPVSAVQSLLVEVERAGFWSFDATYQMGAPNCGSYAADAPIVTLDIDDPPRSRRVIHDYGCSAAPQALRLIHRRVDDLARTERWVTADSSVRIHNQGEQP